MGKFMGEWWEDFLLLFIINFLKDWEIDTMRIDYVKYLKEIDENFMNNTIDDDVNLRFYLVDENRFICKSIV